ncbi:hypothetical protein ALC53_09464, partial [Atta colombica]
RQKLLMLFQLFPRGGGEGRGRAKMLAPVSPFQDFIPLERGQNFPLLACMERISLPATGLTTQTHLFLFVLPTRMYILQKVDVTWIRKV